MTVVAIWRFDFDVRRGVLRYPLLGDTLEGSEDISARFNGIGGAHYIRVAIRNVRVRVGVLQSCLVRINRPGGDVDLLS